jgi:hypothetical protein
MSAAAAAGGRPADHLVEGAVTSDVLAHAHELAGGGEERRRVQTPRVRPNTFWASRSATGRVDSNAASKRTVALSVPVRRPRPPHSTAPARGRIGESSRRARGARLSAARPEAHSTILCT